jgi:lysophospholipase L1-like esterase
MRSYTGSGANRTSKTGTLNIGQEFTVTGSSVHVRDLGVWDFGSNGLTDAHVVTLFALTKLGLNPGATPVAGGSVTVPAGSAAPLDSGFRFVTLPQEVELQPGSYAVVAYGMSDTGDPYGDGGNVPYSASGVTDGGFSPSEVTSGASPAFPNAGDRNPHDSASFHFTSSAPPFVRILPLGDSITDGQHGTLAGYRGPLHDLLDAAHYPAQFVGSMTDNNFNALPPDQQHHEGHSGYQIGALQDNLKNWAGPTGSPADIVLLMAGTNDIVFNNDTDWANVGTRLSKLISSIVAKDTGLLPKARLIVAQLTPVTNTTWAAREVTYNQTVAQVVADHVKLGEDVRLVDMHAAVAVADLFTDGEHPADAGYKKMAKAWFDAITAP